jgi:hypothetical protein
MIDVTATFKNTNKEEIKSFLLAVLCDLEADNTGKYDFKFSIKTKGAKENGNDKNSKHRQP